MTSKNKSGKQKDIDDVLSSIDSLLDTATDVEADELPALNVENEPKNEISNPEEKTEKLVAPKRSRTGKKKVSKKTTHQRSKATRKKRAAKNKPAASTENNTKKNQQITEKTSKKNKPVVEPKTKPKQHPKSKSALRPKKPESSKKTESKLNFTTTQADFSLAQKELPVLDEIITEEEMALIAAGKELPKRVITEKFIPKSTADKIIDILKIQLSDYNITRLEYEYLHELIDELLNEEQSRK